MDRLIRRDQSHCPLAGARSKARANSVWTCPPKLASVRIEPKTLRRTNSKISNQPQMGEKRTHFFIKKKEEYTFSFYEEKNIQFGFIKGEEIYIPRL